MGTLGDLGKRTACHEAISKVESIGYLIRLALVGPKKGSSDMTTIFTWKRFLLLHTRVLGYFVGKGGNRFSYLSNNNL